LSQPSFSLVWNLVTCVGRIYLGDFRESEGTLYWESVLTGKRFILLTVHTFATDPVVRFTCLSCACVAILVHHIAMRPFRDRMADVFESLSLLSLVAICTFSLAERRLTIYLREQRLPDPVKAFSALCNGLRSVALAWFQQQCASLWCLLRYTNSFGCFITVSDYFHM